MSKRNIFSIDKSRASLDNSQVKFKTTKEVEPVKNSKRVHFRSQTMISNLKHLNSKLDQSTDKLSTKNYEIDNCSIQAPK